MKTVHSLSKITLAVGVLLAMAFTFSCSQDEGDNTTNGNVSSFDYGSLTYEGQTYKTIVIGTQTWMAENLNYNAESSRCYNDSIANCNKYGRLYDWVTAMNICPNGWHIPTNAEWDALSSYVQNAKGCPSCSATHLKATNGWFYYNGTDAFGFAALPGGRGLSDGSFREVSYYSFWWSASEYNVNEAYHMKIYYGISYTDMYHYNKSSLHSVRCVKD